MPLWDDEKDSLWMLPGYLEGLKEAGATPVILPLTEDREEIGHLVDICDGILLTGGHDVDPSIYGEDTLNCTVICCKASLPPITSTIIVKTRVIVWRTSVTTSDMM